MKETTTWKRDLAILGLDSRAAWSEIQAQYRRLALSMHPDVATSGNDAQAAFLEISQAYERLRSVHREREAHNPATLERRYGDPSLSALTVEELGARMQFSTSQELRAAAAFLLGKIDSSESRELLVRAASDSSRVVRRVALESLGRVGRMGDIVRCILPSCSSGGEVMGALAASAVKALKRAAGSAAAGEERRTVRGSRARLSWEEAR